MAKIDQMSLIIQGLLVAGTALRIIIIKAVPATSKP